jgi:O-antigen ligase
MRVYALYLLVAFLSVYAYRHWYRSLCGLILLMAVIQHPDMPKSIVGIQGLNPWNVVLANVLVGWLLNRRREGLRWDMPRHLNILLLLYLTVMLVSFVRLIADPVGLMEFQGRPRSLGYVISENLVNPIKWVIPGLLLFDGCRSRRRLYWGLASVLAVYVVLAVQVIRWMPPSAAVSGGALEKRSNKIIQNEIGYSRVNMSMMLSGASWAILGITFLLKRRRYQVMIWAVALMVAYAQALTAGRMGYVTWGAVGLTLCLLRWRKYALFLPIVPVIITLSLPGVAERMLQGFGQTDVSGQAYTDDYELTAGRTLIWPYVFEKIGEAPLLGHGGKAMIRTGIRDYLQNQYAERFGHPHNAYLEWLLDNGIVGFLPLMTFYVLVVVRGARLFCDRRCPDFAAVGAVTLALVLALLAASMGSQSFYPREGSVGTWGAFGLMMRLSVLRPRTLSARPL